MSRRVLLVLLLVGTLTVQAGAGFSDATPAVAQAAASAAAAEHYSGTLTMTEDLDEDHPADAATGAAEFHDVQTARASIHVDISVSGGTAGAVTVTSPSYSETTTRTSSDACNAFTDTYTLDTAKSPSWSYSSARPSGTVSFPALESSDATCHPHPTRATVSFACPTTSSAADPSLVYDYSRTLAPGGGITGQVTYTCSGTLRPETQGASGTVFAVACGETSCTRTGLADVEVLATGTTASGDAVTETASTGADGTWDMALGAGTYDFGPTLDGTTYAGQAFDPAQKTVSMDDTGASGIDFLTCQHPSSDGSEGSRPGSAARSASDASATVGFCQSLYTITMDAKLPKGDIVDPSADARYNRNSSPSTPDYRGTTGAVDTLLHNRLFENDVVGVRRQYPACMPQKQIGRLDKSATQVRWYSYIKGGVSLGQLTVTLAWNQSDQLVRVVGTPTVTHPKVTKVWEYRYEEDGKPKKGSCRTTTQAEPIVVPVAGAEPGASGLAGNQFAIMVGWGFPFTAQGIALNASVGAAAILHEFGGLGQALYSRYDKLTDTQKFAVDSIISSALGSNYVKAVLGVGARLTRFGPKLTYLAKLGGVSAERLNTLLTYRDGLNFVAGYTGDYPIMSSVLRGNFVTHYASVDHLLTSVPQGTILSLASVSTKFPDVTLHIRRDAETATYASTVYSGKDLPWHNSPFRSPITHNPFQANPAGYLTYASGSGVSFHSGDKAFDAIRAATRADGRLTELWHSLTRTGSFVDSFGDIAGAVGNPACGVDGQPTSGQPQNTICYYLDDARP